MSGIAMLLAGVIVGAVIASVVWAMIIAGKKRELLTQKQERDGLMDGIAGLLAQADALQANYRCGTVTHAHFIREMSAKIGAISSMVRMNIQKLEVFFVKYAEQQAEAYLRLIENPERRKSVGGAAPPHKDDDIEVVNEDYAASDTASRMQAISLTKSDALPDLIGGAGHPRGVSMDDTERALMNETTGIIITRDADEPVDDAEVADDEFVIPEPSVKEEAAEKPAVTPSDDDAFVIPDAVEQQVSVDDAVSEKPVGTPDAPSTDVVAIEFQDDAEPADAAVDEPANLVAEIEDEDDIAPTAADVSVEMVDDVAETPDAADVEPAETADVWSEKTDEEYVADFEQFEGLDTAPSAAAEPPPISAAEPEPADMVEEGDTPAAVDPVSAEVVEQEAEDEVDLELIAAAAPPPSSPFDLDLEAAETISFDRSMMAGLPAAGPTYARAPIQAEPEPEPEPEVLSNAGITGDDVVDSIDSFFKLK